MDEWCVQTVDIQENLGLKTSFPRAPVDGALAQQLLVEASVPGAGAGQRGAHGRARVRVLPQPPQVLRQLHGVRRRRAHPLRRAWDDSNTTAVSTCASPAEGSTDLLVSRNYPHIGH